MAAVYPTPPPTSNTLDSAQRQRLLKSTQKLGALLGTTPRVFEPGMTLPPPLTPSTRAFRREGKVFHNQSASSSTTSLSSETEGFVWIPSPDEMLLKHHQRGTSTPIAIEFPRNGADKSSSPLPIKTGHKKSNSNSPHSFPTTPQKLSQPLLYRLRSVPIPPPIISPRFPVEKNKTTTILSPTMVDKTTKSSGVEGERRGLSDSDRRRKMAKLTKTLGENVPPELVFGPLPPRSSSLTRKTTTTTTTAASTTMAAARPSTSSGSRRQRSQTTSHRPSTAPKSKSKSKSSSKTDVPRLTITKPTSKTNNTTTITTLSSASLSKLGPTSPVITVTTTTNATTGIPTPKRKHRPRSLTLTHIPIIGQQTRDITIDQPQTQQHQKQQIQSRDTRDSTRGRSLDDQDRPHPRQRTESTSIRNTTVNLVDFGRRKEKEWSGEWNVRDMTEVMNALRGLRVR